MCSTCPNFEICSKGNLIKSNCTHYNEVFSRTELMQLSSVIKNLSKIIESTYNLKVSFATN
jgi:hypothetical protein